MKKILFAALLAAFGSAQATVYDFSMTTSGGMITGSFNGTADGNLISDLSNVSVAFNGIDLTGSGYLFTAQYANNAFVRGAVASFNGLQNNFLFINSDFAGGDYGYTNYFYSISALDQSYISAAGHDTYLGGQPATYSWTVAAVNAVPEPASAALLGLGLAGLTLARRRKA